MDDDEIKARMTEIRMLDGDRLVRLRGEIRTYFLTYIDPTMRGWRFGRTTPVTIVEGAYEPTQGTHSWATQDDQPLQLADMYKHLQSGGTIHAVGSMPHIYVGIEWLARHFELVETAVQRPEEVPRFKPKKRYKKAGGTT